MATTINARGKNHCPERKSYVLPSGAGHIAAPEVAEGLCRNHTASPSYVVVLPRRIDTSARHVREARIMPRRRISPNQLSFFDGVQTSLFEIAEVKEQTSPGEHTQRIGRPWLVVADGTCFPRAPRVFCRITENGGTWARPNEGRELRVCRLFQSQEEAQSIADRYDHFNARVVPARPEWMKETQDE